MDSFKDLIPKKDPKGGTTPGDYGTDSKPIFKNGSFLKSPWFIFLIGWTTSMICGLVLFSVKWGALSQQFNDSIAWQHRTDDKIEQMNKEGTVASKYGIRSELQTIENHETRIRNMEAQTDKMSVLIEKMSRVEEELKNLNQRTK